MYIILLNFMITLTEENEVIQDFSWELYSLSHFLPFRLSGLWAKTSVSSGCINNDLPQNKSVTENSQMLPDVR